MRNGIAAPVALAAVKRQAARGEDGRLLVEAALHLVMEPEPIARPRNGERKDEKGGRDGAPGN